MAAQRALCKVVCAVGLNQLAVSRVVIGERQRRQGLPEAFCQRQVLWCVVLELSQLHCVLQDDVSTCLATRHHTTREEMKPITLKESSNRLQGGGHLALGDLLVEGHAVVDKQGVGLLVLRVRPGTFKGLVAVVVVHSHLRQTKDKSDWLTFMIPGLFMYLQTSAVPT